MKRSLAILAPLVVVLALWAQHVTIQGTCTINGQAQPCTVSGVQTIDQVAVSVSPATVTLSSGGSQQFTATVSNAQDTSVTWTASAGSVDASGLFTAPQVLDPTNVTVTATSVADPSKMSSAVATINPLVSIAVTPSTASLLSGQQQQFVALVSGTTDNRVSWGLSGVVGTVDQNGLFQATATGTGTVTATSLADPLKFATAQVIVSATPPPPTGSLWEVAPSPPNCTDVRDIEFGDGTIFTACRTQSSFYRSTDGGKTWTAINSGITLNDGSLAWTITPKPGTNIVIAGTAKTPAAANNVKFYLSTDNGNSWSPFQACYNLSLNPSEAGVYWTSGGRMIFGGKDAPGGQYGILYSDDDGVTCHQATANAPGGQHAVYGGGIGINHKNGDIWFGTDQLGLFRSTDNGLTYQQAFILTNITGTHRASGFLPDGRPIICTGDGVSVASDIAGSSFTKTWQGDRCRDLISDANGNWYFTHRNTNQPTNPNDIYRSTDGGQTWQPFTDGLPSPALDGNALAIDQSTGKLWWAPAGGSVPLYRTVNPVQGGNNPPPPPVLNPPVITNAAPAGVQVGTPFSFQIQASNSPTSYDASPLPAGLAIDKTKGLITGTPSTAGVTNIVLSATNSAGTGSATLVLTVSAVTPPPPPPGPGADNRYVNPDGSWIGPTTDGTATLPHGGFYTAMSASPSPGKKITVCASGCNQTTLAAAYSAAACGDTIALRGNESFNLGGGISLNKKCDAAHWLTITTDSTQLPAEGTRITPCQAGFAQVIGMRPYVCPSPVRVIPQLQQTAFGSGIAIDIKNASYHRLVGLEVGRTPFTTNSGGVYQVINITDSDHIIIDRTWAHGDPILDSKNVISIRGSLYIGVIDNYLNDAHCEQQTGTCSEGHGIGGANSLNDQGYWKIVNNLISAGGEDFIFGGANCNGTPCHELHDLEIRRNHFYKNPMWRVGAPGEILGQHGNPFIVKNAWELKAGRFVLVEGNVVEGAWRQGDQFGWAYLLGNRNGQNVSDVTIRHDWVKNTSAGAMLASGLTTEDPNSGGWDFSLHDIVFESILSSETSGSSTVFQISSRSQTALHNIKLDHLTVFVNPAKSMIVFANPNDGPPKPYNITITNSIFQASQYTVHGAGCAVNDQPLQTFDNCWQDSTGKPAYLVTANLIFNESNSNPWPTGNWWTPTIPIASVGFVNPNNGVDGDYHLTSSSPYKGKGTDGKDIGADIDAILSAIQGVQ